MNEKWIIYIPVIVYNRCTNTQHEPAFKENACHRAPSSIFRDWTSDECNFPLLWDRKGILFSHVCLTTQTQDCERLWWGEDVILSASSRPTEPVISELEIHRASSNRPRPWSSSHRITAWAWQSEYAYSNLLVKGSFKNLYVTGTKQMHQWTIRHPHWVILCNAEKPRTANRVYELHLRGSVYSKYLGPPMAYITESKCWWNRSQADFFAGATTLSNLSFCGVVVMVTSCVLPIYNPK